MEAVFSGILWVILFILAALSPMIFTGIIVLIGMSVRDRAKRKAEDQSTRLS